MIVYSDAERIEAFTDVRASALAALDGIGDAPGGLARHQALVAVFIRAGELVRALADAEFEARGHDAPSAPQAHGAALMLALAIEIDRSWSNGFQAMPDVTISRLLLAGLAGPRQVRTRTCEGYAHYALYPESYLEAARRSRLDARTCVIGIRSIGVGLGALVASTLRAAPAITLRPVGPPFDREVKADSRLIATAAGDPSARFAIVDEGPGLSGSSFAAVARWLRKNGVAPSRISFFPSHDGKPGAAASPATSAIWSQTRRHVARQDEILLHRNGLRSWARVLLGSPVGPLREVRLGGIPRDMRFERRKFVADAKHGVWLLKFAGLGRTGERKLRDAERLTKAGFIPEVAGLCHGFLVQRWMEGQAPARRFGRDRLLRRIGAYLAFRACSLPAACGGASLEALREMTVQNTREVLGPDAATAVQARLAGIHALAGRVRPVRIDGRLHPWEWLETRTGLLKTDAVDHCESHDLVGCQDIAWDVAGAAVEYSMAQREISELRTIMRLHGARTDSVLVGALIPCYLAFQLGLWSGTADCDRAESYATHLRLWLDSPPASGRG